LVILVLQNSGMVLIMRYSRVLPGEQYISSTAVLISEIFKVVVSTILHVQQQRESAKHALQKYTIPMFLTEVFGEQSGFFKLLVPAALYTIQNNLQYVAATNLDAATFQVTYQLKILTTAVFSVLMLNKQLGLTKWVSLLLLTAGVAIVQLPSSNKVNESGNSFVGLLAVAVSCVLSGLAGVYFEKILKGSSGSLWLRNIQMGLGSAVLCLIVGVIILDGEQVSQKGFFVGYNLIVLLAILFQAGGGLIVAVVVKYADNILKGFCTSISIILSSIISVYVFDFQITTSFLFGAALVIYSTYLYGKPDSQPTNISSPKMSSETKADEKA